MLKNYKYKPLNYFLITFVISWMPWSLAIYASHHQSMHNLLLPLVLAGLLGPTTATLIMLILGNSELRHDFIKRLHPNLIGIKYIFIILFLFPCIEITSIAISILLGEPTNQLHIVSQSSDLLLQGKNFSILLLVFFLVGPFEETGWRGYATDSLRSKYNLIKTSLIFSIIWGIWHIPLFFIKEGEFQQTIWNQGWLLIFIYFSGLFLITIITNWLYFKNNRSILVVAIFHSIYDTSLGIFHITPTTWIILWIILLLTSLGIVLNNKNVFMKKQHNNAK